MKLFSRNSPQDPGHKTCTLRRSLYVTMAVYILLAASAVVLIQLSRASLRMNHLSYELLFRTANEVEAELYRLFEPIQHHLETLQEWGAEGRLRLDDSLGENHLLPPMIANTPQVISLTLADESGHARRLRKSDENWPGGNMRPPPHPDQGPAFGGKPGAPPHRREHWEEMDSDLRKRTWFAGALSLLEEAQASPAEQSDPVFWSEPYECPLTHEPAITAAVAFSEKTGERYVLAVDVKLTGLSRFTSTLTLSDKGLAFVCTDSGLVLGRPHYAKELSQPEVTRWLEEVNTLEMPEPALVMHHREEFKQDRRANFAFNSPRGKWRATLRAFPLSAGRRFWIGVALPVNELLPELRWRVITILVLLAVVLALAMLSASHISHRYSRPLEILVDQSARIAQLDLRPVGMTHSRYREIDQLTHAMEAMRLALQGEIDKRQEAAKALEDSEARSRGILEAASEAIITINDDDTIDSMNPAGERMFGYREEEVQGMKVQELIEPEELNHYRGYLAQLRAESEAEFKGKRIELNAQKKGGEAFPISVSLSRVRVRGKHFFTALVTDVSDKKYIDALRQNYRRALERDVEERTRRLREKHEALEKTLADLQEAQGKLIAQEKLASLGSLTAGIAHEIKNPLNFVNNFADVTIELVDELKEFLNEEIAGLSTEASIELFDLFQDIKSNVEKIATHGKRADSIVQGMLAHSRGEGADFQRLPLNELIEEDVQLAYHGMRARDPQFYTKIALHLDPRVGEVEVAPQNFGRVVLNLVNNACQSVHKKKQAQGERFAALVEVTTIARQDYVEVRVRDNGLGIPQAVRQKVFEPFFTTKGVGEGTGLGLSICYNIIVDEHQGEMWVESEEDEYAEFVLRIPKSPPRGKQDA